MLSYLRPFFYLCAEGAKSIARSVPFAAPRLCVKTTAEGLPHGRVRIGREVVDAIDAADVDARALCRRNRAGVFREVDPFGGFLWWDALLPESRRLLVEITPVGLEVADVVFALEHAAVSREDGVEVQRHHLLERRRPFLDECVARIRERAGDHVAGRDHAFLRQEHDHVAV